MYKLLYLWVLLSSIIFIEACKNDYEHQILDAINIADTYPDSSLLRLNQMNCNNLNKKGRAMYALAYSIAQDKLGEIVKNDSLIRIAYNYYLKQPNDPFYGRCMYYMGCYYLNVDSLDRASFLFKKAQKAAEQISDTSNLCLALERLAKTFQKSEPKQALQYINRACNLYNNYSKAKPYNIICYNLMKAECHSLCGSPRIAYDISEEMLDKAEQLNDSSMISAVYQELSWFSCEMGNYSQANEYSLRARDYACEAQFSTFYNIVDTYRNIGDYDKCWEYLDSLSPNSHYEHYVAYYMKHDIALKQQLNNAAGIFADSAFYHIEAMYQKALNEKDTYYSRLMQNTEDKRNAENNARIYKVTTTFLIITLLLLSFLGWLLVANHLNKIKVKQKHDKEIIKSHEMQLALMKDYLIQRFDIVRVLEEHSKALSKRYKMKDSDWIELEQCLNCTQNMFVQRLRNQFKQLSEEDIHLLILLRLKIPTKMLAEIYGIAEKSVKQNLFLFKKKIGIEGHKISLRTYIENY